ncbi:hypothetical protein TBLA_0C06150 [Henningerozyma blattae CBS 6284]|uniref:Protein SYS1 n=1 Tax=Henningerozyma blattae (strain ATCC 34711 / CBS 6284 / DSM 70876 / NBRC 10599 / NRRL Y-10934 / UCD 77-7) TaxID=1071380 RepID=I2H209_HENB6|nr:hypothetical protein TBLA_0C06150 [Tetrapisispora blattae CBS 6284]CCH60411.1 hypothetical protein TBLA_0C06150 [Tetrapisispora blattae CBS 6284]
MLLSRRMLHGLRGLRPSEIFKQDSLSPRKIALQIIILQMFYYITASILFSIWAKLMGFTPDIKKWICSWEPVDFTNSQGISISILWLLDSLICVFFLTVIVGRSKLAWDFALTVHAINLILVWTYTYKFPSFSWFVVQFISSLILIFLGTWTSRWKELRDTFFDGLVDPTMSIPNTTERNSSNSPQFELRDLESQK